ncbi:PLASTID TRANSCRIPTIONALLY ACTIVE protein 6, chloroplastic-like [Zingiber officinale]|uniref:PLASTID TRANSCRIPTIONALLY ACTIVE protein 6, chloroplastic-like n=1 Tax=Zingiber officinale TaxID=94328 RepID=UPI001C4ADC2B|nr:PLASTID TRANSCRIPTIONALLY ACTIVE protein 6, chloroplastic-like [Zingiber officinale]
MYVTPPDMDVYSIPKVLAPMPQKYIRCAKSNFGSYNVTEPPIDAPRDPLYKTEREIMKEKDLLEKSGPGAQRSGRPGGT